jgi:hypothetical protein
MTDEKLDKKPEPRRASNRTAVKKALKKVRVKAKGE